MPTNSAQTLYENQRYELIKQLEEGGHENPEVYLDGAGIPTMGVGFNLLVPENVIEILANGFGISDRTLAEDLQAEALAIKSEYDAAISAYKVANPKPSTMTDTEWSSRAATSALASLNASNSNHMSPQDRLDAIFQAAGNTGQFIIQPSATETAAQKIRNIFDALIEDYEITLSNRIGTSTLVSDYSNEHLALISLEYNNGNKLIGSGLKGALSSGNRFEAWYQIRYQSNRYLERGIAKRRYLEADLFGVFSSDSPTNSEAKAVIDAFLEPAHFAKISSDEREMGKVISGVNVAQMANRDYGSLSFVVHIPNFGEIFKPITSYLLERFNPDGEDITHLANTIDGEVMLGILNAQGEIASSSKGDATKDKNDLLIAVEDKASTLVGGFGDDILIGNAKGDILDGGSDNDILLGNGGVDTLIGGEGDDLLDGGTGNDTMSGGKGNDTYYVDSLLDVIVENAGEGDADTLISSIDYALTDGQHENIENFALDIRDGGSGLLLSGNESDNILVGNQLDNIILGGKGSDKLYGGEGNDHLEAGEEDVYTIVNGQGSGDINYLHGEEGNDTLIGGAGVDHLYGGTGDDTLYAGEHINREVIIIGDPYNGGSYTVHTHPDYLYGGEGMDKYFLSKAQTVIYDSDGQGEIYLTADGINDNSFKVTGATFTSHRPYNGGTLFAYDYRMTSAEGQVLNDYYGVDYGGVLRLTLEVKADGSNTLHFYDFGHKIENFHNGDFGIILENTEMGGWVDPHPRLSVTEVIDKLNFDDKFDLISKEQIIAAITNIFDTSNIAREMLINHIADGIGVFQDSCHSLFKY